MPRRHCSGATSAYIPLAAGQSVALKGDLSEGKPMEDISWAWNSAVACFPATASGFYQGHHVLFMADIPTYSELTITLTPDDKNASFGLYAYQVGQLDTSNLVPNLNSCIRCEADPATSLSVGKPRTTNVRQVDQILAINKPYQCVIGIVGPEGWTEGGFSLKIDVKNR
ncbi:MAG: hypothetical protein R2795_06525 [Saprospiraceae bacterium]